MSIMQTRRGSLGSAAFAGVAGMLMPLGARVAESGLETQPSRPILAGCASLMWVP